MMAIVGTLSRSLFNLFFRQDNTEEIAEDEAFKKIIRLPYDKDPEESLPRFGPFYGDDQQAVLYAKKKTWKHVKNNWSSSDDSVGSAKEVFVAAIRRVEEEAAYTYGDRSFINSSKFRLMMVKDGCFFLQLAFLILGKSTELGYSEHDLIFGKILRKKDIKKWIESMFYVGNQIPFVVLKELMKEKFFQNIINKINWDDDHAPPRSFLFKKVFYDQLVLPNNQPGKHCYHLLHGLRKLVVGPAPTRYISVFKKVQLQEEHTNEGDIGNLEGNTNNIERQVNNDDHKEFPSATELKQAYVIIKKLKNGSGIRGIHFQSYLTRAYIYLPVLTVDDYMEILLDNLRKYEIRNRKNQQVSSYLRLMSDIIQKPEDVKLLKKQGIVEGNDDALEKLPSILKKLVSSENDPETSSMTHEFQIMKRKIRDYSSPWIHYQSILNLVMILTLVQTVFAVLSYCRPPK